ncbi:hypothetical protein PV396_09030 [Streptomyces sp. ME02-8801-2C]|uniref:hypothetical protein n=1 Tax=Streptomyces sp. ME02-8801-2C TaxID=3028680 RepID=UPI0029BC9EAB|nr:hypothetical protein [Streptomyces sp. ME02-8801-2C]MDX3452086.1 hypothetical protein [Streptomyces sp. ME02-8801-2C]
MALIVSFLAIAFLQSPLGTTKAEAVNQSCPGGFTSGQGSSSCPNLHNSDLLTQRPMPRTLYRGDSRTPFAIFNTGFGGRGANNDIVDHVRGDRAGNSNYVSTSEALGVAVPFARSQGLRNLESAARTRCATSIIVQNASRGWLSRIFPSRCGNQTVSAESYVYEISPTYGRNAVYVPDQIRGNSVLWNHYASQQEWAYVHRIPREAIQGVRVYRMTARANQGLIDTRSITFTYDRYIINPHYGSVTVVYNPNNDANSFFSSTSDLDVPSLPANPYTRGCSAITRCRGGGN